MNKFNRNLTDWKFMSYQYYIRYRKFIDFSLPIIGDESVLDVGCASAPLATSFKLYAGLDNSKKLVAAAKNNTKKAIIYADAYDMPLRAKSFSYFICRNLLEHTKKDDEILRELKRVVSKGGIFELPCSDTISWWLDPINLLLKKLGFQPLRAFSYGYGHINMLALDDWLKKIKSHGFKIEEVHDVGCGVLLNFEAFIESLFLSYGDNDLIPAKKVPSKLAKIVGKIYEIFDKIDLKIAKSWTKLIYVSVV